MHARRDRDVASTRAVVVDLVPSHRFLMCGLWAILGPLTDGNGKDKIVKRVVVS